MGTRHLLALVMGYGLLGGCAQGPLLHYTAFAEKGQPSPGDYSGRTKFTLAKSVLLAQKVNGQASIASVPAEATGQGMDFGILTNTGGRQATLEVTKIGDTNLVDTLALRAAEPNVSRSEARVSSADAVTAPSSPSKANLALAIDVQALLNGPRPDRTPMAGLASDGKRELAFEVVFEAVPSDAIETAKLDLQRTGNLYFHSACRTATITFLNAPLADERFTLTVADPNYVQTISMEPGRSIASRAGCGVDVFAGEPRPLRAGNTSGPQLAQARSLASIWVTTPLADREAAMAALKPVIPVKSARRKSGAGKAAASQMAEKPVAAPEEALRNTESRVPPAPHRESFTF